jgi:hypothetical protein
MADNYSYPPHVVQIQQDGNLHVPVGQSIVLDDPTLRSSSKAVVPILGGVDTGGGLGVWQNNTGGAVIIDRVVLDVTTASSAACSLEAGTTAASATTASANLITGQDVHSAIVTTDNIGAGGAGKYIQRLAAGGWVTFSTASGASAGLAGNAYVSFFEV